MKSVPYPLIGQVFSTNRPKTGLTQPQFAEKAGVSQQNVSRWEQGLSRPRLKELAALATLLKLDVRELEDAAGYSRAKDAKVGTPGGPTYDIDLPLHYLQPQSFENFCMELLRKLNPGCSVNRFGGPGSKQDGIDIEVRGDGFVHTFQCKQVRVFGEAQVDKAVAKQTFVSDLMVILLSMTASTGARKAIAKHAGWQLWDRNDVSSRFRDLPKVVRRDLVDTYFPGQRRAILGETEAGPFQSFEDFFKQFNGELPYFNHTWQLVGRDPELGDVLAALEGDVAVATLLSGPPGNGKSRLLREIIERFKDKQPGTEVWFASPTEDVKLQHLQELGEGPKLLVIDDAHERDDLGQLFNFAAVPQNKARLLIALRPYGRTSAMSTAARAGMQASQLCEVPLRKRTKKDAQELAEMVLRKYGDNVEDAQAIAEYTYATPLATVVAAQIVARDGIPVDMLRNSKDFQHNVLGRLQTVIEGDIVATSDVQNLRSVLRVSALLQPIVFDDPAVLNILRVVEDLEEEDVQRMVRVLTEAGVLFKRGLRYRVAPDLLADDIIQSNFIDTNGRITSKVHQIFEVADAQYLTNLLVNLGRLDWRLKEGATLDSELLTALEPKLKWGSKYHHPHVEAMEAVAYYQPRLALRFAERLIAEGHGQASGVSRMLRNAAYNFEVLRDACYLLWKAAKGDQRPLNQQPNHGVRILKELAEFEPYKPVQYVDEVVTFALELLQYPKFLDGPYTPFDILEGALRTEIETMSSRGNQFTISRYALDFKVAKSVRERIIDALISSLSAQPVRRAFLAASTLSAALRNPQHSSEEDLAAWNQAHADVLERVLRALQSAQVSAAVLMKAAMSVSWQAMYNDNSPGQPVAKQIIGLLDRDLQTRVTRHMADAWGVDTWEDDEPLERKAHQADFERTITDVENEFPDAGALCDFIERTLNDMQAAGGAGCATPQIFVNALLSAKPDFAQEVMERQVLPHSPLKNSAGAALAVCMDQADGPERVARLLDSDSQQAWELVSEAYARRPAQSLMDADMAIVRRIFKSPHPRVLIRAATIARNLAADRPALAVELIASADFTVSAAASKEFLMWLSHRNTIPPESISEFHWGALIERVGLLQDLDDHWTLAFLRKAVKAHPAMVLDMYKARLLADSEHGRYRAVRHDREGDGFKLLEHEEGLTLLRGFLKWAVDQRAASDFSTAVGSMVSALCGKYTKEVLQLLFEMLKSGGEQNVDVVVSVLRGAHQEFVIDETAFVKDALNQAEVIGEQALQDLSSALWASTLTGGRGGVVGEPFKEDVRLKEHCETVLKGIGRLDPAYSFYSGLLRYAQDNIERQKRTKRAMQEAEDE